MKAPSALKSSPIQIPDNLHQAIQKWDLEALKESLTEDLARTPIYIPDDWTYPSPLFYFLKDLSGFDVQYWESGGENYDPRPFLDVFLEKGSYLDWDDKMMPEEPEKLTRCFPFFKAEKKGWEKLFSTTRESLNSHMAEVLFPYFVDHGAQIHLSCDKNQGTPLMAFLDGVFFNENSKNFKNHLSPEALNILTILDNHGCILKKIIKKETKDDPHSLFTMYWQAWQDQKLKVKLSEELRSAPSKNKKKI